MSVQKKDLDLTAVWRVVEKFKESVLRLGINLYEHFEKFDPSGEQMLSEYYFRKVLDVCLKNEVPLSENEISVIVDYFKYRDGRIMYTELCDRVHDRGLEFSTDVRRNLMSGLEWEDPMHINALRPEEETKICALLDRIASILVKSDHPIDVHFKEYEQIARNPGCVSLCHLSRILAAMSIKLHTDDFNLLVKRYSRHSFLFNFIPFLDDINKAMKRLTVTVLMTTDRRYMIDTDSEKVRRPDMTYPKSIERGKELGMPVAFRLLTAYPQSEEGPHVTMRRIKHHTFVNTIDLNSIFKDIDKFNRGVVTPLNFRRALTNAAINCGFNCKLTLKDEDVDNIINIYRKPREPDSIMWRLFVNDVQSGLLKKELTSNDYDEDSDLRFLPAQGNVWDKTPEEERELCEETLERLRSLMKSRRWTLKQFFIEWDPGKCGHVNLLHFRNILTTNRLITCPKELDALEKRYVSYRGFDYMKFFDELRTETILETPPPLKSSKSVKTTVVVDPCDAKAYSDKEMSDALRKVRKQIVVLSRKLDDYFKQFDPLNRFVVSKDEFFRVLGTCKIEFTPEEGEMLAVLFRAPLTEGRIDYRRFLDTIDEAYTQKGLEKAPLLVPVKHVPVTDDPQRFLNMSERRLVESALDKMSRKINIMNFDDAKAFDRAKAGDLSHMQLMRFLSYFNIKLSDGEVAAIMKAFGRKSGGILYIEYLPLLTAVDILHSERKAAV